MSQQLTQDLRAFGTAQVIVKLKQPVVTEALAAGTSPGIQQYFTTSELSQDAALATATGRGQPPPVHYYPNLGLALGTVTREGLAALRADTDRKSVV